MPFNPNSAKEIALRLTDDQGLEKGLVSSFVEVCRFLSENSESMSWRGSNKPSLVTNEGLERVAEKFFSSYRNSNFPAEPSTVPDEMVSIVMQVAYGYSPKATDTIKIEHQRAMCAENCVGALLERYLDSVIRQNGWHWCCGDFVKAIDFIKRNPDGTWIAMQIKNRDNSENSSSSGIRSGTPIQKWFRSFSKTGRKNWENMPEFMQRLALTEEGFIAYARNYLKSEQTNRTKRIK